jgi:hypothetical protein
MRQLRAPLLAALAVFTLSAALPLAGDPRSLADDARLLVRLVDAPRRLSARPWGDLALLVARPGGGFLVAFTSYSSHLMVGLHREDGSREAVRHLGSLGYSGVYNLRSLQPLAGGGFVASWDNDHKYTGFLSSRLAIVDGSGRRTTEYRHKRSLAVVGVGQGEVMGFYRTVDTHDGTYFAHWDRDAHVRRSRQVLGTGLPLLVLPFRGGSLLLSARTIHGENQLEWFDAAGRRVESVPGVRGFIATNGVDAIVEVQLTDDQRRLLGRFGASPATLGRTRLLATELGAPRLVEAAAAIRPDGLALLAWVPWPQPECAVWVRLFDRRGQPASAPLCAVAAPAGSPRLAVRRNGRFWLAWRTTDATGSEVLDEIWLRTLAVVPADTGS